MGRLDVDEAEMGESAAFTKEGQRASAALSATLADVSALSISADRQWQTNERVFWVLAVCPVTLPRVTQILDVVWTHDECAP